MSAKRCKKEKYWELGEQQGTLTQARRVWGSLSEGTDSPAET